MTPPALYCDHDSSDEALVEQLRLALVDVLTAHEAHNRHLSDPEQLEFAAREGRAVYTANKGDFARLHTEWASAGRQHAGIIIRRNQLADVGSQLRALMTMLELHPEGLANLILWV
ncbi:MAG: DUF5615 family PIN-like protein [Dehalococcoidia bacterium]